MPVSVPQYTKGPAHPVHKSIFRPGDASRQLSVFHNLTQSLPLPPPGPPPSFGTREEWISSLPSWRQNKPRRIWEEDDTHVASSHNMGDFQQGLINADNASVIKGDRAQACIPPVLTLIGHAEQGNILGPQQEGEGDADDEMSAASFEFDAESQWSGRSLSTQDRVDMDVDPDYGDDTFIAEDRTLNRFYVAEPEVQPAYGHNAYTPLSDDMSPEPVAEGDPQSSPLGPMTPFGEFVDRAVETALVHGGTDISGPYDSRPIYYSHTVEYPSPVHYEAVQPHARHEEPAAAPDPHGAPSVTLSYKKVADPLAEWVASYVWKACTTGMSLPPIYGRYSVSSANQHSSLPPSYLANCIRSLFMSTLLQPSAIFLAVWYIVRLPIQFGHINLGPDYVKETRFRTELYGPDMWLEAEERENMELQGPFRLVLLGCMLANKWLDDHTFSNKTWHTVSAIPIQSLNRLESLALDIFSYDLSVPSHAWAQWLDHALSYHMALSSPTHPQPISRPSSNPFSIVRKTIEDIAESAASSHVSRPCGEPSCRMAHPEPVFLGLEERRRTHSDHTAILADGSPDVLEIDLDEDGPLREEYMPKRRVSRAGSLRESAKAVAVGSYHAEKEREWERAVDMQRYLPPPAKWSPAADEPLQRDVRRSQGHHVAVRPPMPPPPHGPLLPPIQLYHPVQPSLGYHRGWNTGASFANVHVQLPAIYPHGYGPVVHSHSRSASSDGQCCGIQDYSHARSHSQSHFDYACSDIRMTAQKAHHLPPPELHWTGAEQYGYGSSYGRLFVPDSGPHYEPHHWVRA